MLEGPKWMSIHCAGSDWGQNILSCCRMAPESCRAAGKIRGGHVSVSRRAKTRSLSGAIMNQAKPAAYTCAESRSGILKQWSRTVVHQAPDFAAPMGV